ncbi:MAG TPA: SIR2 family protein, partial [Enhygromyxa sp.]|nr:SIR2 family protein [Enhygromyxa sp.]
MARPTCFDLTKLENLAERIYHGQVVFFVGAGFSLDSEGLTGARLLLRLLARFDALTSLLMAADPGARPAELATRLRKVLRETFWLGADPQPLTTAAHAKALAADYYRPNEWMCEAFGTLLDACDDAATDAKLWAEVHRRETELLEAAPIWGRVEQLGEIEPRLLAGDRWGPSARGKALFLDTLGFADPWVMAGRPHAPTIAEVEQSYSPAGRSRLRPRHEVIARWAREGLCRTLLTTNYDVLVEGAYRLSGFACRQCDDPSRAIEQPPLLTEISHFARVGEAVDFFRFGHTHRSALVAKIHGCAECYRWLRAQVVAALDRDDEQRLDRARQAFANYLPAIVFTFREIQNWRQDAWSRDLLANLLRTRSIVFCGYSTQDRVLHDAFRTAFEEIARVTQRLGESGRSGEVTIVDDAAAGAGAAAEAS